MVINFDLWSKIKGHLVASERSDQKNDVIFEFLDPKNLYFNIHHGKKKDLDFDLWSEVKGHLVASERSYQKNDVIFEFLDPKNLYFDIHHG